MNDQQHRLWAYRNACALHRQARGYQGEPRGPKKVRRLKDGDRGAQYRDRPLTRRQRLDLANWLISAVLADTPGEMHDWLHRFARTTLNLPGRQFGMVSKDTFDRAIDREYNRAFPQGD